jgi:hypothetical protein
MTLALDILKVFMWVMLYFGSIAMLAVMSASLVFMVGALILGEDITDIEPEEWSDDNWE